MAEHDWWSCDGWQRMSRRRSLGAMGTIAGAGWLTSLAERLARAEEKSGKQTRPKSLLMLWLAGGPSQLETFDPHPGTKSGGDIKAISTSISKLEIADTLPLTAE